VRTLIGLDNSWFFKKGDDQAWLAPGYAAEGWKEVSIPAPNLELPLNGFDEKSYQFVSTWLRDFELDSGVLERGRVFVDFEGVMTAARVFVNGREAGSHAGGYTPFSLEITGLVKGGGNRLAVQVDSRELPEVPPFGHVVDYLSFGGIYREVSIRTQGEALIADLYAKPTGALDEKKTLQLELSIDLGGLRGETLRLEATLGDAGRDPGEALARGVCEARGEPGRILVNLDFGEISGLELWEPANPRLYELVVRLLHGGVAIDEVSTRIGWREAEFRPEGFFLNGRLLKLRGLNRHQSFPYVGYAMPARAQRRDAEILKRELGVNLVRSSHYPPSRHFLDACDELGLLVFEELPGWHHIGGPAWKDAAILALEEMILRDRNHPSIVLWGVRINESPDDHDFYLRTNETARRLDPLRQRGGVRDLKRSELLEDVYTYNDFVHSGANRALRPPRQVTGRAVPYLVTEHNGHMFPVKRYDQEERLAGQALRHARVLDAAYGTPGLAGAVGWCAFDYNTHKDFGSGDRVCYHGVSDMFRIPKYAAAVYASQVEPTERVVLEVASLFAKGERDAAALLPVHIWTNCDEIVLYRGGERVGTYLPDRAAFPHLPHPPVVVRDLIGDRLEGQGFSKRQTRLVKEIVGVVFTKGIEALTLRQTLRMGLLLLAKRMSFAEAEKLVTRFAIGWGASDESFEVVGRVGGKEVARRRYGGDAHAVRLEMTADDGSLAADGIDVTRVVLRLLDQYANVHPFAAEAVVLSIEGPGEIVGPRLLALQGGVAAFWVRSRREKGRISLRAAGSRFDADPVEIITFN
jgi:beta-galactosidase